MGKQSKHRRSQLHTLRLQIRALHEECASQRHRAEMAEHRFHKIATEVMLLADASALLPVSQVITRDCTRVPPKRDPHAVRYDIERAIYREPERTYCELTHVLMSSDTLRDTMTKALHFRVENPPGRQPSFTKGYAISHHALLMMRNTDMIARQIAEEFGAAIAKELKV